MSENETLRELLAAREVLVCCGSGGVGKTTAAAALALAGARAGRRVCVVTIDPARRLADALGLDALTNTPSPVDDAATTAAGGALSAMMLEVTSTFDDTVRRNAKDEAQAQAILDNRIYQNISKGLSGTQEYMAMEKLWQLHADGAFDLVVIDTPPSRNALDFLDAPDRLSRFIDHRLFRLMTLPTRGAFRAVSLAAQAFVRTITKVVGGEVVSDVLAFLTAFEGMEQGFRDRATAVRALMEDEATAFVLVASPRRDTVVEALFFAQKLREAGIRVRSLVVNRVHPGVGLGLPSVPPAPAGSALAALEENLAALDSVAAREREHLGDLTAAVAPAPVVLVPFLASDVHDVEGLGEIAAYLLGETSEVTSYRTAG